MQFISVGASGVEGNENVSSEDQAVDASPVERNDSASSEDRPETSPAPQGSESESLLGSRRNSLSDIKAGGEHVLNGDNCWNCCC